MDLIARSLEALDWGAILERLAFHARTARGAAAAARPDFAADADGVARRYAEVAEVLAIEGSGDLRVPVGEVGDVVEPVQRAGRGIQLDLPELRDIGAALVAFEKLRRFLEGRLEDRPRLWALVEDHVLDGELVWRLSASFDADGQLSAEMYPELGHLRSRIAEVKRRVRSTLDELLRSEDLADALQDRYVTERGGRFVLPIKSSRRSGIGIVHDTSQSGETFFVEPAAVVEQHNRLRELEAELVREERRILTALSLLVGKHAEPTLGALDAAVAVDLACARAGLGEELRGVIPEAGRKGAINLKRARHPVLQLRGVAVVPNDLAMDHARPALVLTGPNTGGKTIAMKTMGLCALMARAGVPIPADEGSSVGFFDPVLASVGDLQSVEGDLSTFSGQVMVIRAVLSRAAPGAMVLLDEIAVGTDPAQGAALARAVLEAVVEAGARVSVTTHYTELKALAEVDERFTVAALEYIDGSPTYRLTVGHIGQSHALETARRLGLSPSVLERARALLGDSEREMGELLDRLEAERVAVSYKDAALKKRAAEVEARAEKLEAEAERLRERAARLRAEVAERWTKQMAEREQQVVDLIAALQANPDLRTAGKTLEQLRELRAEVAQEVSPPEPEPAGPPPEVQPGDRVRVRSLRKIGEVVSVSGSRVEVRIGRIRTRVKKGDLEAVKSASQGDPGAAPAVLLTVPPKPRGRPQAAVDDRFGGVRTVSNSCDLRGMRVEGALDKVEKFLDDLTLRGEGAGFILHGHGTGALKQAVREWLPASGYARRWRPGGEHDGGDAWTVVEIA